MDVSQIISALGGRAAVAELVGSNPHAVGQWTRIGVPAKFWVDIVERAEVLGVQGITIPVLKATKPERVAA